MDKVYTVVSDRVRINCAVGSRMAPLYKSVVKPDGTLELKLSGERDIYSEIQSHKASTDINEIIRRFTLSGDEQLFNVRQAMFGDFVEMPKTYAEMFQRMLDAEAIFNGLPTNIKEQFNNNLSEFLASFGTEKFASVFGTSEKTESVPDQKEGATE